MHVQPVNIPFATLNISFVECSRFNSCCENSTLKKLLHESFMTLVFAICNSAMHFPHILMHTTYPISWFLISQVQTNLQNT